MKRLINYIKNLFGADVRLRKWCVEQTIICRSEDMKNRIGHTKVLYDWIKQSPGQSKRKTQGVRPKLGSPGLFECDELAFRGTAASTAPARSGKEHLGSW